MVFVACGGMEQLLLLLGILRDSTPLFIDGTDECECWQIIETMSVPHNNLASAASPGSLCLLLAGHWSRAGSMRLGTGHALRSKRSCGYSTDTNAISINIAAPEKLEPPFPSVCISILGAELMPRKAAVSLATVTLGELDCEQPCRVPLWLRCMFETPFQSPQ